VSHSSTFYAPDIECEQCGELIQAALLQLDGVHEVAVDLAAFTVTVGYDEAVMPATTIRGVLEELGYPTAA